MVTVRYPSAADPAFVASIRRWFTARDEVLVMIRYANAGGSKDYELHRSSESIAARIASLPPKTSIIVFRETQLPIRGVVDRALIDRALAEIRDGEEFLMVETVATVAGPRSWYHSAAGECHSELQAELESSMGRPVMLGVYPPWLEDGPEVISGFVPDADGQIRPGAY